MPNFCEFDDLNTGDTIGQTYRLTVTARNDSANPMTLTLVDTNAVPAPGAQTIPAGSGEAAYQFDLTHNADQVDDTITVELKNGGALVDSDTVSLVQVKAQPPATIGMFPVIPMAGEIALATGIYTGTYVRTGANTVIVEVLKKRAGGKRKWRTVLVKQAELTVRLTAGAIEHVWEVGLPVIRFGNASRVAFRVFVLSWEGEVIATAARVVSA